MSRIDRLAPGVHVVSVALDDYDVRGAVLVGGDHVVVWDTLSHPRDMSAVLPLLAARPVSVVYSHADWDHCWGTGALPGWLRVIGHESCRRRFSDDVPRTLAEKQAAEPGAWDAVTLVPPTETFSSALSVDLGDLRLELQHLPGHTADCIVGLVPERGLLLAGDTLETPCPVVPRGAPLDFWIAGLDRLAHDPRIETVVPAHGPVGGRGLLEVNIAYLDGLRRGRPIAPAGALTPFYRDTHAANLRWRDEV